VKEKEYGLRGKIPCYSCGCIDSTSHEINGKRIKCSRNDHPTIKPIALMRWLIRLVMPPVGGIVMDPFMGSGTTLVAAALDGRGFVGIDKELRSLQIARARVLGICP
jgi:site-specific DNA-methyltransferase (adenine-specific)